MVNESLRMEMEQHFQEGRKEEALAISLIIDQQVLEILKFQLAAKNKIPTVTSSEYWTTKCGSTEYSLAYNWI